MSRMWLSRFLAGALAYQVAGCAIVPGVGPTSVEVVSQDQPNVSDYEVIDVDARVASVLKTWSAPGLSASLGGRGPVASQRIGTGDDVVVTIFEASSGGLFGGSGTGAGSLALQPQSVSQNGSIVVPYVGAIQARGKTPQELGREIEKGLEGKAIQPQVTVSIAQSASSTATVVGDTTGAGRVNLNIKGDRLLEVIAQAGGVRAPPHEAFVRLTRGNQTATVQLSTILTHPAENIFIRPGDTIYVYRQPQTFTALGAVKNTGELPMDREPFMLSEALGVSGGLANNLADTRGVFLFRFEQPSLVRQIKPGSVLARTGKPVPVIYHIDMRNPVGYFIAKDMRVRTSDIMFVSTAPTVELIKFVSVIRNVLSVTRSQSVLFDGG